MANAPTRQPSRPRSERRPPKGPPVARTRPTYEVTRAKLVVASERLRELGEAGHADLLDSLLAPRGWELLRPPAAASGSAGEKNMAIHMNKAIRDRLKQLAEEAGNVLSEDVNEGYEKFLAGRWTPRQPIRSRRGSGVAKANLNVTPDAALRRQVGERTAAATAELGWTVTEARVASAWLMEKYGITDEEQAL